MMEHTDIARASIEELTRHYQSGTLSPVDVVKAFASRVKQFNSALNAFLSTRFDAAEAEAVAAAERWREGKPLSAIDGIVFGVKANIAVAGLSWHGGIEAYKEQIAKIDAPCIENLKAGGAIVLGNLNMHEGALGATTDNPYFGKCFNPWGDGLTPGGSSGGSAASVAAGLCTFSLGTDTMGSVRIPSAYCGIAGHKPSYGIVPAGGLIDLSPTLDHIGPHARSSEDLALILPVLAGSEKIKVPMPYISPRNISPRIGAVTWGTSTPVEDDIAAAFKVACETLSHIGPVKDVDLSGFDFGALRRRGLLVSEVEGYRYHEPMLAKNPDGFSDDFAGLLKWGHEQTAEKQEAALQAVRAAGDQFATLFDEVDIIVTPTAPQSPFSFDHPVPAHQADFTCLANFAGAPATAVPATIKGAPPGSIQFIAKKGNDALTLALAKAFEENRGLAPVPPGYFD